MAGPHLYATLSLASIFVRKAGVPDAGQPIAIKRDEKGKYQVSFGRIASFGGTVQVSAYGSSIGYCTIQNWNGGTVKVWCFDSDKQLADREFSILAMKGSTGDEAVLAYAWLNDKSSDQYAADINYRFGNGNMVVKRTAKGRYGVNVGSPAGKEASVLTSGYKGREHCATHNWGNRTVIIICNTADGTTLDSQATVLVVKQGFPNASFLWNSKPEGAMSDSYSAASDGSAQSVTKLSTGRYRVKLGPEANSGGNVGVL